VSIFGQKVISYHLSAIELASLYKWFQLISQAHSHKLAKQSISYSLYAKLFGDHEKILANNSAS